MQYRRFGKTELEMPVLTTGGMRFQSSWKADETEKITDEEQANLAACLHRAVEAGMIHIETARGYGTSEYQIGLVLPELPRDRIILQTKISPPETGEEFLACFEESCERLGTEKIDLLSLHGINNREVLERAIKPGGSLEALESLREQGRVGHIGFSSHGRSFEIIDVIETGRFEYVNLHWFWVQPDKWPAIAAARARDMGVFLISPNDKGGKLYEPSDKLIELCSPMPPMIWNDLYCLAEPDVHTLSIGAASPDDYDLHLQAIDMLEYGEVDYAMDVADKLEDECIAVLGEDWWTSYLVGLPDYENTPGQMNLPEILRLYNLAKALGMVEYGRMRYNLLGSGGHWFPGNPVQPELLDQLAPCLADSPHAAKIPAILAETHEMLKGEDVQRLQEDD